MAKYKIQIKNNSNTLDNLVLSFDEIYIGDTRIRDDGGLLSFETEDPILFQAPTIFYEPLRLYFEDLEGGLTLKNTPSGPSVYSEYFSADIFNSRVFYLLNDAGDSEEFSIRDNEGTISIESINGDLEIASGGDIYIRQYTYFGGSISLGDDGYQEVRIGMQDVTIEKNYDEEEGIVNLDIKGQDVVNLNSKVNVIGSLYAKSNVIAPDIWFDSSGDICFGIDDDGTGVGVWTNGGCFNIHGYLTLEDQNDGLLTWIYVDNSDYNEFNGKRIVFEETNINAPCVEATKIVLFGGGQDVYLYNYYDVKNDNSYVDIKGNLYVDNNAVIDGTLNVNTVKVNDTLYLGSGAVQIYEENSNVVYIEGGSLDAEFGLLEDGVRLEDKYALKNGAEKMSSNYIGHPEGGDYRYLNQITGAICIKVPRLAKKGIISFNVTVANSRQYSFAEYKISGYQSGAANWYNWSAICITSAKNKTDVNSHKLYNLPVKYAFNTSTNEYYIYIGELTTQFSYPVVTINNVTFNAFSNDEVNKLRSGWVVSIVSSYPVPVNDTFSTEIYTPKLDYTLDEIGMPNSSINAPFTVQPFMGATRAMRLFALPTDQIIVEQSVDGGATWSSANVEDWTKQQIFSQTRLGSIPIPLKSGKKSCSCMVRVTITGMKYNVPAATVETQKYNYWNSNYVLSNERYCTLDFGYFWISANYDKMYIEHQVSTGAYPNDWIVDGNLNKAQGWSGGDYVKFSGNAFGGGTTQIYNYWNHRFIFRTQASDGSFDDSKLNQDGLTTQQIITEISCYGQNCWTAANEMMKSDRPYTVNNSNQTTFTGDVVVQGAMYPQGYVSPQTDVYAQASVYAKKGFIFSGQSDQDQKLLRADGWWQHINTIRNPYTKYNLYNTDKYTQVVNGSSTIITLNEQFGYYYIDLAMLNFPSISTSAYATVIIKSNYPNTKCVVYCDRYAQSYNIICMQVYAQYGYVFPTSNNIDDATITALINNEYDLANNYVEYEHSYIRNAKFLIEWTEHGDCKVMPTFEM